MPELPEVETIKRDLNEFVLKKRIKKVKVYLPRLVKQELSEFVNGLEGESFSLIERVGKLLIFNLYGKDKYLLIHLKMTGQLIYVSGGIKTVGGHSVAGIPDFKKNKYTYIVFEFFDKSKLFFNDLRTFAYLKLVDKTELEKKLSNFGLEPLTKNFKLEYFRQALKNKKINIKSFLLNQKYVSGIGNIYADEILFESGVRPNRISGELSEKELEKIFKASEKIIAKAIKKRGTTFNNYVDGQGKKGEYVKFLKVYGRGAKPCLKCGKKLEKIKLVGRGTVYCPLCQK